MFWTTYIPKHLYQNALKIYFFPPSTSKFVCWIKVFVLPHRVAIFLHRYICHICDISQLCCHTQQFPRCQLAKSFPFLSLTNLHQKSFHIFAKSKSEKARYFLSSIYATKNTQARHITIAVRITHYPVHNKPQEWRDEAQRQLGQNKTVKIQPKCSARSISHEIFCVFLLLQP